MFDSPTPDSTESIGARLAGEAHPGQVIGLVGELGAGKTVFVRGAVGWMGGDPLQVRSPTFTLLNLYSCAMTVYHFDLYRLDSGADLEGIGFYEFAREDGLTLVEWADRFDEVAEEVDIWVTLDFIPGQEGRRITVRS
ncbi:MAG: tRNA (adenosine(37)-N6)-threonylcarbamoyltransferase complex ATPase subunit type 1 TsaE [Deltaproteobacteria bacterium]|nr:tRNA (adenosine(37)-N6)-threonylcarbamoyltransferase complex ATPase subunit type 1 TsaE [Deltaproteobacteria bacterium]